MSKKKRIEVASTEAPLTSNPFSNIHLAEPPISQIESTPLKKNEKKEALVKKRGRIDIRIEKAGRGGKIVTVIQANIMNHQERQDWLKKLKSHCGCGGTLKEGNIELQGNKRDDIAPLLKETGFQVVFSGG